LTDELTVADRIIQYQFWFEYGIGKLGVYLAILNLGLLTVTTFTVKGFFFPAWGIVPIAIAVIVFCTSLGWFLATRRVMARLNSHMNQTGNPEFITLIETVDRLEEKVNWLCREPEPLMWEIE
jgi:hypothetical protein